MDCIFNELSTKIVDTVSDAQAVMSHFVYAVRAAQQYGLSRISIHEKIGQNLFLLVLAPNYSVGTWLNDDRVDEVLRERFRQIVANPPLLSVEAVEELNIFQRSMFSLVEPGGVPEAEGFGAAYLTNSLLLSLFTDKYWDTLNVTGWHWYIDSDDTEKTEMISVPHFATREHFEELKSRLQEQQLEQLQRSTEVWEKRADFFPHLILCGDVKRQLRFVGTSSYLNQIIDRLRALDDFVSNWHEGDFNVDQINDETSLRVSGESDLTMRQYGGQRRFKLPNGRREIFELHIKTGNLRFHFFPDEKDQKVYIGYIGKHLSTWTDKG